MPLIVGVICGAYSSIFITASFWYIFGGRKLTTVKKEKKVTKHLIHYLLMILIHQKIITVYPKNNLQRNLHLLQ
jgi:hypothetical protein